MLRRLRARFVLVMMVLVTVTLCLTLGTIYRFTARNLEAESIAMMRSAAGRPLQPDGPGGFPGEVRLPCAILQIGRRGEIAAAGGELRHLSDPDLLREAAQAALAREEPVGILEEYALRYCRIPAPMGQTLVFADVTGERAMLGSLLQNCLIMGGVCFAAFLGISVLLARWMVRPVERAWEEQRQFVSDASHELKTPLTVIMTNAELLQGSGCGPDGQARFSQNILVMSRQMRQLVERLLELARADSGRAQIALRPLNLSELTQCALLPFEPVFFEQGLELTARIQPELWVSGSEGHLGQVLDILLDNARKYADPAGPVRLTLERKGRRGCLLSLSNPGPELSREELRHIFQRFYRGDQARSRDGSFGLGLSIAEGIVSAHHGRIWAESREGTVTFFVELPLSKTEGGAS